MVRLFHLTPHLLSLLIVYQIRFKHLLSPGHATAHAHMQLPGNSFQLHRAMLTDATHDHRLAPVRLVDGGKLALTEPTASSGIQHPECVTHQILRRCSRHQLGHRRHRLPGFHLLIAKTN